MLAVGRGTLRTTKTNEDSHVVDRIKKGRAVVVMVKIAKPPSKRKLGFSFAKKAFGNL